MEDRPPAQHPIPHWLPAHLLAAATPLTLGRGECLFRRGEPVQSVYFVCSGEVKAVRYQPDGRESVMVRASGGDFFAESSVIVEHYVCDAFAVRPCSLQVIPAARFRDALIADSHFAFAFANHEAAAARRQCSRYERLRLPRARDRVLHLLSCETDADGRYALNGTQAELAAELGLQPETLYRTIAALKLEGLVAGDRRSLRLIQATHPAS